MSVYLDYSESASDNEDVQQTSEPVESKFSSGYEKSVNYLQQQLTGAAINEPDEDERSIIMYVDV